MKTIRIIFTICAVLAAITGYIWTAGYLLMRSASESQILVPAIVFTVLVGGLMVLVLSITAHVALGSGLRSIAHATAFSLQNWRMTRSERDYENND